MLTGALLYTVAKEMFHVASLHVRLLSLFRRASLSERPSTANMQIGTRVRGTCRLNFLVFIQVPSLIRGVWWR